MAPAGMSLERRGEALGVGSETQPLRLLLRHVSLQFTGQEGKLPEGSGCPRNQRGSGEVLPPYGHFL